MIKNNHLINMNNSFSILALNSFLLNQKKKKLMIKIKKKLKKEKQVQKI